MSRLMKQVYCAFCRVQRRIYSKNHIGWTNILYSALASALLMFVLWQTFDPKVFILFALFLCFAEVFILVRWRLSVKCPYCGFDPVLYKKDQAAMVRRVNETLELRKGSVDFVMSSKNPFQNLPKRVAEKPSNLKLSKAASGMAHEGVEKANKELH